MLKYNGLQPGLFLSGLSKRKNPVTKRYQDYVLMSHLPSLDQKDREETAELAGYANNTLTLISHRSKKSLTYPFPLVPLKVNQFHELAPENIVFERHTLKDCASNILSERQYCITFHVVGHGTPNSIGSSDFSKQVSPETYADGLQSLFEFYGLGDLRTKPIAFVFHTCNSAYVSLNKNMTCKEVLEKIQQDSFIARFYQAMKSWGMQDLKVTGYRGYYTCILSEGTGTARIQNSILNPTLARDALHGEYTISKEGCVAGPNVNHHDFFFPVTVYENPLLDQALNKLHISQNMCKLLGTS